MLISEDTCVPFLIGTEFLHPEGTPLSAAQPFETALRVGNIFHHPVLVGLGFYPAQFWTQCSNALRTKSTFTAQSYWVAFVGKKHSTLHKLLQWQETFWQHVELPVARAQAGKWSLLASTGGQRRPTARKVGKVVQGRWRLEWVWEVGGTGRWQVPPSGGDGYW